jgi:Adenosine-deaminase (editase) domain
MSYSLSDRIAQTVLEHYKRDWPTQAGKPKDNEWTVLAAIVATRHNESQASASSNDAQGYQCNPHLRTNANSECANEDETNNVEDMWVVCSATGTKCTAIPEERGSVLHDSHAEVLCRRGLIRILWHEIIEGLAERVYPSINKKGKASPSTELAKPPCQAKSDPMSTMTTAGCLSSNNHRRLLQRATNVARVESISFELSPNIRLHMYISDMPCGDASIYEMAARSSSDSTITSTDGGSSHDHPIDNHTRFTGAKVILSPHTGVSIEDCGGNHQSLAEGSIARENVQLVGKLRTKSGRSNLVDSQRSASMSCSDKLARWCLLGWQGGLLSRYIPRLVFVHTIIVSLDPLAQSLEAQHRALSRSIAERVQKSINIVRDVINEDSDGDGDSGCIGDDTAAISLWISSVCPPRVDVTRVCYPNSKSIKSAPPVPIADTPTTVEEVTTETAATEIKTAPDITTALGKRNAEGETISQQRKLPYGCKVSPCGFSINWQSISESHQLEVTIGARGIRQGKKPKSAQDVEALQSRLSRSSMVKLAGDAARLAYQKHSHGDEQDIPGGASTASITYQSLKRQFSLPEIQRVRSIIFSNGPLAGWIESAHDFPLSENIVKVASSNN